MKFLLNILGFILIIVSVMLIFWNDIEAHITQELNGKIISAYVNQESLEFSTLESLFLDENEIKDSEIAGSIEIPSAAIFEPVFKGPVTYENLKNGVSLIDENDNFARQNINIAGHRVEGVDIRFNNLGKVQIKDDIILSTDNKKILFKVTEIFEVDPSEVNVLEQKEGERQEITLITCEDYNPDTLLFETRLIVKAVIAE